LKKPGKHPAGITRREFTKIASATAISAGIPAIGAAQRDNPVADRRKALDHVVVIMFENRSFDNLLGRLYAPGEAKLFEGVMNKGLKNPILEWAQNGADRKFVAYGVAPDMNTPRPDSGEEWMVSTVRWSCIGRDGVPQLHGNVGLFLRHTPQCCHKF
jgi:hypothetical protein